MTGTLFIALLPLIALTVALLGVMVWGAFFPNHRAHWLVAIAGHLGALAGLAAVARYQPLQLSSLFLYDRATLFFTAMILLAGLVVTLISYRYLAQRTVHGENHHREYYLLLLLAMAGAVVLIASRNVATLFLGLEILSVSLFGLIAYPAQQARALEAGIKYLLLSGSSSALLLFGLALIYAATGSLEFGAQVVPQNATLERTGVLFTTIGFAFKLSLVPFHMWTPDVFEGAPAPVSTLIASVSKGAVAAAFWQWLWQNPLAHDPSVLRGLGWIAVFSIFIGNLLALFQSNIKRLLAYSSIGQMGFWLVPLAAGGPLMGEAAGYYIAAYVASVLAAFSVITYLSSESANEWEAISGYGGLFWRQPLAALVLGVALLSLAGIPLTVGFIGKFYIFAASAEGARWGLVIAVAVGSAIAIYYYLRVITTFFAVAPKNAPLVTRGRGVLLFLLLFIIFYGIVPSPLINAVRAAVALP